MSESILKVMVIDEWNSLSGSIIHSTTVNTLKAKVNCLFKNRGYIFALASFLLLATFLVGGLLSRVVYLLSITSRMHREICSLFVIIRTLH